jgi:hypothetical protein
MQAVPESGLSATLKAITAAARQEATDERQAIMETYARRMDAARLSADPGQLAGILRAIATDRAAALAIAGRNALREAATERESVIQHARSRAPKPQPRVSRADFRAAAKMTKRVEAEGPKPRRRRSGETGRAFMPAARAIVRRTIAPPIVSYARATAYLADTLDWLNLWQDNSADECGPEVYTEPVYLSAHL